MKIYLGIISVIVCLCGLTLAFAGSQLWVAAVCVGLMLSTMANNYALGRATKERMQEESVALAQRERVIHFLTTFLSVDGELPMTRKEAERYLDDDK